METADQKIRPDQHALLRRNVQVGRFARVTGDAETRLQALEALLGAWSFPLPAVGPPGSGAQVSECVN